jgi:hypothetical protein
MIPSALTLNGADAAVAFPAKNGNVPGAIPTALEPDPEVSEEALMVNPPMVPPLAVIEPVKVPDVAVMAPLMLALVAVIAPVLLTVKFVEVIAFVPLLTSAAPYGKTSVSATVALVPTVYENLVPVGAGLARIVNVPSNGAPIFVIFTLLPAE